MIQSDRYHQLRLYDESEAGGIPTLAEFFDEFCLPNWLENRQEKPRDPKTIAKYRDVVRHWSKCHAYRSDGPAVELSQLPVDQIENWHVDEFRRYLREVASGRTQKRLSPQTVENYEKTLLAILYRLGPPGQTRLKGADYLDYVPSFYVTPAQSHKQHGKPRPWTLAEVSTMLSAVKARRIRQRVGGVRCDLFWQAILTVAYYTGLRIRPITLIEYDHIRHRDGEGSYLSVPVGNDKFDKPHETFLHPVALRAIAAMNGKGRYVFPWRGVDRSDQAKAAYARGCLYRSLRALIRTAGVDKGDRKPWHGFRFLHHSTLSMIDPYAAHLSLNHGSSVGEVHYLNKADRIAEAILKMPSI